jgi:ArsR family transcriptional regulator, arsenate/arsenite/antimonite-responsive transcriptional repressor
VRKVSDLFDVLADTTRRDIVMHLNTADQNAPHGLVEMSVGELVQAVGSTQPTVSKHLKVLREADLVRVREDGQHRYYRLNPDALAPIVSWLVGVAGEQVESSRELEVQRPLVDLWSAGFVVGRFVGDARDAVLGLIGHRFGR